MGTITLQATGRPVDPFMLKNKFTESLSKLPGLGDGDLSEVKFEYLSYLLPQTPGSNADKVVQIPLNKTHVVYPTEPLSFACQ